LKANIAQLEEYKLENEKLKEKIEQLNVGRVFAGIEKNNEEAKQKIDSLIKEINLCIMALKD
jgi:phage shock protein A